jgi:hypothetical protein
MADVSFILFVFMFGCEVLCFVLGRRKIWRLGPELFRFLHSIESFLLTFADEILKGTMSRIQRLVYLDEAERREKNYKSLQQCV